MDAGRPSELKPKARTRKEKWGGESRCARVPAIPVSSRGIARPVVVYLHLQAPIVCTISRIPPPRNKISLYDVPLGEAE